MSIIDKIFRGGKKRAFEYNEEGKLQGGWNTISGDVDFNNYTQLSQYEKSVYVYRSVKIIADKVANIDYDLYKVVNPKGETKKIEQHDLLELLEKPNPFQSRQEFLAITEMNKLLTGEAYWHKIKDRSGNVLELWNIRPDIIKPVLHPSKYIVGYELQSQKGPVFFSYDEIVYFTAPNPIAPFRGTSPIAPAKNRILTEDYATAFQRDFFKNNALPDAIITTPHSLSEESKNDMRRKWNAKFKGVGSGSKLAFLEGGAEYHQVSTNQKEMDYIETLRFIRDDILVAFGVPKGLIVSEDANNADGDNAYRTFLAHTVDPEVRGLYSTINQGLTIEFGDDIILIPVEVVPENRTQMLAELEKGVDKWITRNEARQRMGLPDIPGGDVLYNEMMKTPIIAPKKKKRKKKPKKKKEVISMLRANPDLVERLILEEKITKKVIKSLRSKKDNKAISIFSQPEIRHEYELYINKSIDRRAKKFKARFNQYMHDQEVKLREVIQDMITRQAQTEEEVLDTLDWKTEAGLLKGFMLPTYKTITRVAGEQANELIGAKKVSKEFILSDYLKAIIDERAIFFANSVTKTTFTKLAKVILNGIDKGDSHTDISDRVSEVFDEVRLVRADMIARTETTFANNLGFQEAYSQDPAVEGKEWIATHDSRVRAEHLEMDGQIVGVYENFPNGLPYPQEVNCRCVIAPAIKKVEQ